MKLSLSLAAIAFVASLGLAATATAECQRHMQSVQTSAPATVVDATPLPPSTPVPETKTGG